MERLAILPFELLSGEGETDRVGPELLASALTGVPNIDPLPVDSVEQAYGQRANRFLHTYVVNRAGQLQVRASIEDAVSHKMLANLQVDGNPSAGMGPLVALLAKKISPAAKPSDAPPAAAYERMNRAFEVTEPAQQDQAFQAAIQADPHFGAAYVTWVNVLLARGDQERAEQIAAQGESASVGQFFQAELAYLQARARAKGSQAKGTQESAAEIAALKKLIALSPASSELYGRLAGLEFAGRQFNESSASYREALRLDPANGALNNMLGYAEAFAGHLEQARQALKTYSQSEPEQRENALDSLGEVDFFAGDFAGAESAFLAAQEKNPSGQEWLKAAQAHLMNGDLAGADRIFARFSRPQAVYERAQWEFITGRRKSALAKIQAEAAKLQGGGATLLWAQAAIWQLQTGDQAGAANSAKNISLEPASPARNSLGGLVQFLVAGGAQSSGSPFVDAVTALLHGDFPTALPLLEQAYARTAPSTDGEVRILLAWANVETGHIDRAKELLRMVPIPMSSGDPMFTSLIFPRYFALRAAVLSREGKNAEAERDRKLYSMFSAN